MRVLGLIAVCLLLSGCPVLGGIRSSLPEVPKVKPCEVIVRDDQGHAECISRDVLLRRWIPRNTGQEP